MSRILVVDDELRICRFVARSLTARGHKVDTAGTAGEAVRLASERPHGLIILDLVLPDGDGYEVLSRVLAANPSQRVIVLSALTDVDSRVRSLRLGAVDFVAKPFSLAELLERVRLRGEDRSVGDSMSRWIEVGGMRLDRRLRVLWTDSRMMELSPREFVLMEHLMTHANQVCTRGELLDTVWGYSFDPGSNVVDVCVRRLRTKLRIEAIETVRNVGYCFVAS